MNQALSDIGKIFRLKQLLDRDLQQIAIKYNTHYQIVNETLAIIPWIDFEDKDQCVKDLQEIFPDMQIFHNTEDFDKVVITGDLLGCMNNKYIEIRE